MTSIEEPAGVAGAPPRENPYVGLLPFGEDDVTWFFGRDREQRIIGANLRSTRLTLLYGASGVGKSSVLLAGVVPALRKLVARDRAARELEDEGDREPVRFAVAVFSSWTDAPLHGLAAAVAASVEEATGEPVQAWTPGTPLADAFAGWLGPVGSLLIVLDQFEEYFLYHPHDDGPGTFAGEFVDIVTRADLRVNFLVSLREDGLAKLDRFKGRIPRLFDNYLRVGHLDLTAARRAVEGPLAEYNRRLPAGAQPAEIDEDLIATVLTQVRTRDAALDGPDGPPPESADAATATDRVETPLLQLVMQRLWAAAAADGTTHLRLATLRDSLGGTERIVYRHLEDALATLSDAHRELAVDVLRPLVSPTGTKIAWRAADIAYWAKHATAEIEPILEELARGEQRILRATMPPPGQGDPSPRYEIFHDILAAPILEWCGEREAERERDRLATRLEAEEQQRREAARERRRERRSRIVRRVAFGLGALTIGLVAAILVALHNNRIAGSRSLAASAMTQLPIDPERGLLLATRAVDKLDTAEAEQALRRAISASRVRARLDSSGRPRPCGACGALPTSARAATGAVAQQLAIAPDGRTVAGVVGERLQLWRPQTGERLKPGVDVGGVIGVAFTPDARRLLVVGARATALMTPDGTAAKTLPGSYSHGATSDDGRYVATLGAEGGAVVWAASSGKRLRVLSDDTYDSLAFGPRGDVVLQDFDGRLLRWRWRSRRVSVVAGQGSPELVQQARFATTARFAVNRAADAGIRIVSAGGKVVRLPAGSGEDPVSDAVISPDGTNVATLRGARVELWQTASTKPRRVGELVHTDRVNAVVFSPDGTLIATASTDGTARVWESSTGALIAELRGHAAAVLGLAFNAAGRFVATASEDLTIRLWDLGRERALRGSREIEVVAPVGAGSRVVVAEDSGELEVWDSRAQTAEIFEPDLGPATVSSSATRGGLVSRRPISPPSPSVSIGRSSSPSRDSGRAARGDPASQAPTSVALSADGRLMLVGYMDAREVGGRALLLETRTGRVRATIARSAVRKLALRRDGRLAAVLGGASIRSGLRSTRVDLWEFPAASSRSRRVWQVPVSPEEQPTDVAFSPDGRRLLVTTLVGGAFVFDVRSHRRLDVLASGSVRSPGAEAYYRGVFSPDGGTIAVGGSRDVRLWDAGSGDEKSFRLSGHTSVVRSVAYSRGGRRIVTASSDGTTRVWDASTGEQLSVLARHAGRVNSAAFLNDGSIVAGGEDRAVRVYPCETCVGLERLQRLAATHATRDLTDAERRSFER